MNPTLKWTVVIPTCQRAQLLLATLKSLDQQTLKDFDVIVVVDGEDVATRALSTNHTVSFPLSWIFHDINRGLAASRNTGASTADGEMLLFLDDDIVASPDLISSHACEHAAAPDWPEYVVFGRTIETRRVPIASKTDELLQHQWEYEPPGYAPDTLSVGSLGESSVWFGLNCSIRRSVFADMRGFDPVLRMDEERELGLRLYRNGIQFRYAREAVVWHQDTKNMSVYFPRCWRQSGSFDVYRARKLGQRSAQNSQLATMRHGPLLRRMLTNRVRRNPEACRRVARVLEHVTDLTGTRRCHGMWTRLRSASEYWNGVRDTGVTEAELHRLAGPARRVLLFHSISTPENLAEASYYTSPDKFRRCLEWIRRLGYRWADPDDWFCEHVDEHNVWLTFDDAYDDLYTEVLPIAAERRIWALVFVVVNQVGGSNKWDQGTGVRTRSLLTREQILEMQKYGFSFGAHSMTHEQLTTLSNAALRREVSDSKHRLEDLLGEKVNWFSYPFGEVDRRVRAAVAEAGFKAAFTTHRGLNHWEDPLALKRIDVSECDTQMDFIFKLQTGKDVRRGIVRRVRHIIAN